MDSNRLSRRNILRIILLIIGVVAVLLGPFQLPARVGAVDFRPYWSSTFLLAHGQDFSDPLQMFDIEQTLTGWNESYVMHAWFAPTGNVILLPYILLPFSRATYYWLLTNIIVVFFSAILIWRNMKMHVWIPLVAAFSFSMTLLSLIAGQVNTFVVLGLALFLLFSGRRWDYAAGISLVLTTVKPHLVILTLPLLLLDILWRKQWRVFAGFVGALLVCILILFVFFPGWPISFSKLVTDGMGTVRETPTVTGLLVVASEYRWGKWIWVVGLLIAIFVWWKRRNDWDRRTLIDTSILAGIIVSPIGWSYDQVMLLFPILSVLKWTIDGSLARKDATAVALVLIIANALTFYERILSPSEVWFFWVPLVVAGVYVFARQRRQQEKSRGLES